MSESYTLEEIVSIMDPTHCMSRNAKLFYGQCYLELKCRFVELSISDNSVISDVCLNKESEYILMTYFIKYDTDNVIKFILDKNPDEISLSEKITIMQTITFSLVNCSKNRFIEVFMMSNCKDICAISLKNNLLNIVEYLFEIGTDILPMLAYNNNYKIIKFDMVQLLLKYGTDIYQLSISAIGQSDLDFLKFCIACGADTNHLNGELLNMCLCRNNLDLIKYLVENGADPNLADIRSGFNSMSYDLIMYLIDNGLDLSSDLPKIFISSCLNGNMKLFAYCIDSGVDIHLENDLALFVAANWANKQILLLLLDLGSDINAQNNVILDFICGGLFGPIFEHIRNDIKRYCDPWNNIGARMNKINSIIKILVDHGAIISPDSDILIQIGECILNDRFDSSNFYFRRLNYIDQTDYEFIQNIIDTGININTTHKYVYDIYMNKPAIEYVSTVLELYIMFCTDIRIIKLLLINGADYSANNFRALELAIEYNNLELVKILLDMGSFLDENFELEVEPNIINLIESYGMPTHNLIKKLII